MASRWTPGVCFQVWYKGLGVCLLKAELCSPYWPGAWPQARCPISYKHKGRSYGASRSPGALSYTASYPPVFCTVYSVAWE